MNIFIFPNEEKKTTKDGQQVKKKKKQPYIRMSIQWTREENEGSFSTIVDGDPDSRPL